MSPILVRPVREQFEHDRVIRVLQARYKRKFDAAINPGAEQNASVIVGDLTLYPDVVLFSQDRARKVVGTVEVETTESINTLEAMAEWAQFSRLHLPFHLYVPPNTVDTVKRLCTEHQVTVAEIWTYHSAVDQVRFTLVHKAPDAPAARGRAAAAADKSDRADRSDKAARAEKDEQGSQADKPAVAAKSEKPSRKAAPSRAAKTAKPARAAKKAAPSRKVAGRSVKKAPARKAAAPRRAGARSSAARRSAGGRSARPSKRR